MAGLGVASKRRGDVVGVTDPLSPLDHARAVPTCVFISPLSFTLFWKRMARYQDEYKFHS